ncbi:hypothetical protein MMC22_007329 [Lobaria immixta]|nr:hypothetical protein [Lobaria immixta]
MRFLLIFFFAIVRAASIADSVSSDSTDEKTADVVAADGLCSFEGTRPHGKRQVTYQPVIKNPMQTLDEGFRNLLQLNEPKQPIKNPMQPLEDFGNLLQSNEPVKPIEIPKDSIQVVPKEDDPIIVTTGTICRDGFKAVCCRNWYREFDLSYTVFACWEYLVNLLACQRDERIWCCPTGKMPKRAYLDTDGGSDCYNPYGYIGHPLRSKHLASPISLWVISAIPAIPISMLMFTIFFMKMTTGFLDEPNIRPN